VSARNDAYATARGRRAASLAGLLSDRARRRRYEAFVRVLGVRPGDRILDVGSGRTGLRALDTEHEVVGLDSRAQPDYPGEHVVGDARAMPFADAEFDVAYCNSLLEHLEPVDRPLVAAEVRRVARRWFVQTPNLWFPLEPHVLLPGYQFLPPGLQRRLGPLGVSGGAHEWVRLLDARELARLFPDGEILRERVGPFTKSLMAVGPL
jgi:2-polyprenyl-3-methyl-5-hydroxy-6-metoxy-1,4-benzoquinol methylase